MIDHRKTYPAEVEVVKQNAKHTWLKITIHEGRNRQIRKMCEAVGYPVVQLKRLSVGSIQLGSLKVGEYRALTKEEVDYLKSIAIIEEV